MTKDEAMELALDALQRIGTEFLCGIAHHSKAEQHQTLAKCPLEKRHAEAIAALEAAMKMPAQPEPPPEAQTHAEQVAYAAGWWKALESVQVQPLDRDIAERDAQWQAKVDALQARCDAAEKDAARYLRLLAEVPDLEYETEYDHRMETLCLGCDYENGHSPGCLTTRIQAVLPSLPVRKEKPLHTACSECGKIVKTIGLKSHKQAKHSDMKGTSAETCTENERRRHDVSGEYL